MPRTRLESCGSKKRRVVVRPRPRRSRRYMSLLFLQTTLTLAVAGLLRTLVGPPLDLSGELDVGATNSTLANIAAGNEWSCVRVGCVGGAATYWCSVVVAPHFQCGSR